MAINPPPTAPLFAEMLGIEQVPPGYVYKDVTTRAFPLEAGYDEVSELIRLLLEVPTGLRITPLPLLDSRRTIVYLEVLEYGSIVSTSLPYSQWGFMTQRELIFTVPVVQWNGDVPQNVALFTPYNFVDNPWSMLAGNMLLGFPKAFAWFRLPPEDFLAAPIRVDTQVFRTHGPHTPLSWEMLLGIEAGFGEPPELGDAGPERLWPLGHLERLFGKGGPFEVPQEILALLRAGREARRYSVVQRKQLRDVTNPKLACFLSIVTLERSLTRVKNGGFLPPARIDLRDYPSLHIAQTLGLRQHGGWIEPVLPYWMNLDFGFDHPFVLMSTAPANEGPPLHPGQMGGWGIPQTKTQTKKAARRKRS